MPRTSAGLLMYRRRDAVLEVFLIHMGGPFWAKKDLGAWSIPKGEFGEGDDPLAAAIHEFHEETGFEAGNEFLPLTTIRQAGGKLVHAWAFEGDCDPTRVRSNTFRVEWPPGSGQWRTFPEVDKADWFPPALARQKIVKGQIPLIDELERRLGETAR